MEEKYFTTSDYDKFLSETLDAKIKEKGLVDKPNIPNLKKFCFKQKTCHNSAIATKAELKAEHDKIEKTVKCLI